MSPTLSSHDKYEATGPGEAQNRLKTIVSYRFVPSRGALEPLVKEVMTALQRPFRMRGWDRAEPDKTLRVETPAEMNERKINLSGFGPGAVLHHTDTGGIGAGRYKCFPSFEISDGFATKSRWISTDESLLQLLDAAYRVGEADEGEFIETADDDAILGLDMLDPKSHAGTLCTFVYMHAAARGKSHLVSEIATFKITRTHTRDVVVDIQFSIGFGCHVKMKWGEEVGETVAVDAVDARWEQLHIDDYEGWLNGEMRKLDKLDWFVKFCETHQVVRLFKAVEGIEPQLYALRDRKNADTLTRMTVTGLRSNVDTSPTRVKELQAVKGAALGLNVSEADRERRAVLVRGIEMAIRMWEAFILLSSEELARRQN